MFPPRNSKDFYRAALLCYLLALILPAANCLLYCGNRVTHGYDLLAMGYFGLLEFNFSWLANVTFILGLATKPSSNYRVKFACASLLFGLSTLYFLNVKYLYAGYYFWMMSFIFLWWSYEKTEPVEADLPNNNYEYFD